MAHLAQNPAVGRGDALNGPDGAVGVDIHIHGGGTAQVHILRGDLSVFQELLQQSIGAEEAALAVGDGDIDHVAHLPSGQPGGAVGGDAGTDNAGLVPADDVEAQGGAGVVGVNDLAVGDQTQLDEGLEAVADTQHQAVPVFQQLHGGLGDRG